MVDVFWKPETVGSSINAQGLCLEWLNRRNEVGWEKEKPKLIFHSGKKTCSIPSNKLPFIDRDGSIHGPFALSAEQKPKKDSRTFNTSYVQGRERRRLLLTPCSPGVRAAYSLEARSVKTPLCSALGRHIWNVTLPFATNHAQNDTISASGTGIVKSVLSQDRAAPCGRKLDVVAKSAGNTISPGGRFNCKM